MAETEEMWSQRDNCSNKRTDLAYCIAWPKHGLRPVKSRNWPLKNSSAPSKAHHSHYNFWIDWPGNSPSNEPTADAWSRHWVRCIHEARECDVLLFVNWENDQVCGDLIQAGAASAAGRQVCTFSHLPNCRNCSTLADAIVAIVAMQAARGCSAGISGTNSPYSSSWLGNPPQRVEPER